MTSNPAVTRFSQSCIRVCGSFVKLRNAPRALAYRSDYTAFSAQLDGEIRAPFLSEMSASVEGGKRNTSCDVGEGTNSRGLLFREMNAGVPGVPTHAYTLHTQSRTHVTTPFIPIRSS